MRVVFFLLCALDLITLNQLHAHKMSDSFLKLQVDEGGIEVQWDIAIADLANVIDLDDNGDNSVTWGELDSHYAEVWDYAQLSFKVDSESPCNPTLRDRMVDNHSDGTYAVLKFSLHCIPKESLEIYYNLFFELDPRHKGLLTVVKDGITQTAIFTEKKKNQRILLSSTSIIHQLFQFIGSGVFHIWVGYDHILFLVTLLLPSVLVRKKKKWGVPERFGPAFFQVVKIVTSFTIAHSITLGLAALGVIYLPSRFVESTIALSIVLSALNNLYPMVESKIWCIAFVFGLIHGFGFATVLIDAQLPKQNLLTSLVGFNVGVELGQIVIVGAILPILFGLRNKKVYKPIILFGGSILGAILASIWMVERALNLKLIPL